MSAEQSDVTELVDTFVEKLREWSETQRKGRKKKLRKKLKGLLRKLFKKDTPD